MLLISRDKIPDYMRNEKVMEYYDILNKKALSLVLKRLFDIIFSLVLIATLSPLMLMISIIILADSKGPVVFRQKRITRYGKEFTILKFRTMKSDSLAVITNKEDHRITRVGRILRRYRLDELLQLINILKGDMTFVGTRPEIPEYVFCYSEEMFATLLLPAGLTSRASIQFKDEDNIIPPNASAEQVKEIYTSRLLPMKMKINLAELKEFSLFNDFKTVIKTIYAIIDF